MRDLGIQRRVRGAIEAFVPWFDRRRADRDHAQLARELERSRAVRNLARQELMRGSFARAGRRLGE